MIQTVERQLLHDSAFSYTSAELRRVAKTRHHPGEGDFDTDRMQIFFENDLPIQSCQNGLDSFGDVSPVAAVTITSLFATISGYCFALPDKSRRVEPGLELKRSSAREYYPGRGAIVPYDAAVGLDLGYDISKPTLMKIDSVLFDNSSGKLSITADQDKLWTRNETNYSQNFSLRSAALLASLVACATAKVFQVRQQGKFWEFSRTELGTVKGQRSLELCF